MDRSGAMPRSAWVEIRDGSGELLDSIPARIEGGTVSADIPAFPANSRGTIRLCTDDDRLIDRGPTDLEELPTSPTVVVVQLG